MLPACSCRASYPELCVAASFPPSSLGLDTALVAQGREAPLQAVALRENAGTLSVGEACRTLLSKDSLSRSVAEFCNAHWRLMGAVTTGQIDGLLNSEGNLPNLKLDHWFEQVHTPSIQC